MKFQYVDNFICLRSIGCGNSLAPMTQDQGIGYFLSPRSANTALTSGACTFQHRVYMLHAVEPILCTVALRYKHRTMAYKACSFWLRK